MDIRYKLYPYPVLSDTTDDYIGESRFNMQLRVEMGMREICLFISLQLENEGIKKLIHNGDAEYVIHIECPHTSYRTVIKTDETETEKKIPEHRLNGKVAVCAFIVAKRDILEYDNNSFNEDYEGMKFDLQRGNIIAMGGQVNMDIIKDAQELAKIPSIFTICKYAEDTDESMKIDITGEKIATTLCNRSFDNYKMLTGIPAMLPVLHSMLIVPTLIYTFEALKSDEADEFKELRWYKSIERTLRKNGLDLHEELSNNTPSYELAQKSLDLPIDRALDALASYDMTDEEE